MNLFHISKSYFTMNCRKVVSTILSLLIILFLFSCTEVSSDKKLAQSDTAINLEPVITIDTFSTFPPEIDGCSCYFSNDSLEFKQGLYIYMNDFGTTSFLKINGILTKFSQTDYKENDEKIKNIIGNSENYEIKMEIIDLEQNGDETWLNKGTIILSDKKGNKITKTFYGECGC